MSSKPTYVAGLSLYALTAIEAEVLTGQKELISRSGPIRQAQQMLRARKPGSL